MSVRSIGWSASRGGILSPSVRSDPSSVAVTKSQDDTEASNYETIKRSATYALVRALESEMMKKVEAGKAQVAEMRRHFR